MGDEIVNLVPLDSGGNGDVCVGRLKGSGLQVVVKFLREVHLPHAKAAFAREVRLLRRGLPGYIRILFWNTNAKRPYYVMPYEARGSLLQYCGRLSDAQLHAIAVEIAEALAKTHTANEIHGDVKPANILVAADGHLRIADPLGAGTLFTMLFSENRGGTPGYWAPEIAAGGSISKAGDVRSYGATLYHAATGISPCDGQRLDQTVEGYVSSSKIREVIAACCQFDPEVRPTIQEVILMLRGRTWAEIVAERERRQELMNAFGTLALLGGAAILTAWLGESASNQ